jgi:hypothetical protein
VPDRPLELVRDHGRLDALPRLLIAEGSQKYLLVRNPREVLDDERPRPRVKQPVVRGESQALDRTLRDEGELLKEGQAGAEAVAAEDLDISLCVPRS